jgi:hypothetical protein
LKTNVVELAFMFAVDRAVVFVIPNVLVYPKFMPTTVLLKVTTLAEMMF